MPAGRGYDLEEKRREANMRDDGLIPQPDLGQQRVRRKPLQGSAPPDEGDQGPVLEGMQAQMRAPQGGPPPGSPQPLTRPPPAPPRLATPPGMPPRMPPGMRPPMQAAGPPRPQMQAAGPPRRPMPGMGGAPQGLQQLLAQAGMRPPGPPQIPMGPQRRPLPQGMPTMPGPRRV